mmetsp:Transcript_877/g.2516  ORF Transcript_877/g.2516 Transcript_877/m.2516 type:complete len:144 (-) Transcript_877:28-459(-)
MMRAYAERQAIAPEAIRFVFDGHRLNENQTPEELDMCGARRNMRAFVWCRQLLRARMLGACSRDTLSLVPWLTEILRASIFRPPHALACPFAGFGGHGPAMHLMLYRCTTLSSRHPDWRLCSSFREDNDEIDAFLEQTGGATL